MTKNRAMAESGRARGSDLSLLLGQIRYQNKIFWRTPVAAFFTLVFPLIFKGKMSPMTWTNVGMS